MREKIVSKQTPLPSHDDLQVDQLGPCEVDSPLKALGWGFIDDADRVLVGNTIKGFTAGGDPPSLDPAGARDKIFFDPAIITAGIVTCGGLCPGLNDVVRGLVMTLTYTYGVSRVLGFRYGYSGLGPDPRAEPAELTPDLVKEIHRTGGTVLASCRGAPEVSDMVDTLEKRGVDLLFTIGGDGTLRGAAEISDEIARRRLKIGVVGIPKTIDNDLHFVQRTFGFTTAVEEARNVIEGAHEEARGTWNGVGLVKLMGRHSGFIAAHATLSNADVNFCLIPEVPFKLEGPGGFFEALEKRLREKHHAVVVVAEGAGQDILRAEGGGERDKSGNLKLMDIGTFLRDAIVKHCAGRDLEMSIKYIDPSYIIRSLPAAALDSGYCVALAHQAVHAGMAGKTKMLIGWHNMRTVHVPLPLATSSQKKVDPDGEIWRRVLENTGQPASMM